MSICPICNKIVCAEHFDIWWDKNRFIWTWNSWALAKFCSNHFDKWWDAKKFDWDDASSYLCIYCSKYFDKWWNPDRFNPRHLMYLEKYCADHKDTWLGLKLYYDLSL